MNFLQFPQFALCYLFESIKKKAKLFRYGIKISILDKYAKDVYWTNFKKKELMGFLNLSKGNLKKAKKEVDDYQEARARILVPETNYQQLLKGGVENDKNSSCYIDSLIFAMFAALNAFDPILLHEAGEPHIQNDLRLFINKMRKGQLVQRLTVRQLRRSLQDANWEQGFLQEDVHALFLFLADKLNSPTLKFKVELFNGTDRIDSNPSFSEDRCLTLSIPNSERILRLEDLIYNYCNQDVDNFRKKNVTIQRNSSFLPSTLGVCTNVAVNDKLPFPSTVIPLLLSRYLFEGGKNRTEIKIPIKFNFGAYIDPNHREKKCPVCSSNKKYIMILRSAICHKGELSDSGHYISYTKPRKRDHWYRLDDMNTSELIQIIDNDNVVLEDLSTDGYVLFYELYPICIDPADYVVNFEEKLK